MNPKEVMADRFMTLYPGVYTPRESDFVAKYVASNRAIKDRGPIDAQALVKGTLAKDTPGVGPVVAVTEDWVRYNNSKYDPENPLGSDRDYARKSGYADILAHPVFAAHDDTFMVPYPGSVRDTLLVSDLNHSVTTYRPIYPGDTLYIVANERELIDLTPSEGSIYRTIAIQSKGSIYNQRAELVNDVIFRVTESIKIYKDLSFAPKNPTFFDMWESPDWQSRPAHYYSDDDWARMRSIWSKETRCGAQSLYWEDVNVGTQPTWTLDGPIEASVAPTAPWGMGAGGSRTMKREIMDPAIFATMVRGEKDGIYRLPNRDDYVPAPPKGWTPPPPPPGMDDGAIDTTDIHKDGAQRSPLINFLGREYAIRHLSNWMGDKGWLHNISWSIMDPRGHAKYGKPVPLNPRAVHYLDRVPFLKDRFVEEHGLTQDVAIVKSYVTGKDVRDGAFLVHLVWWIETIDEKIWLEGSATIRLPSNRIDAK